jgi:hypothetical protein
MKTKRRSKFLDKLKLEKQFPLGKHHWPIEQQTKETFLAVMTAGQRQREPRRAEPSVADAHEKALASIATNAWKAKSRLKDADSVEDGGVLKRVNGDLERIWNVLVEDLGLEVKDHTGKDFDYGMALKVVTTQPMAGINKERVIETIKPTIYWKNKIIQIGEVVVATPT